MTDQKRRIGFVSTRFAGTDGVSLEVEKWARVLTTMGHDCFYFSGLSDRPEEISHVVEEAFFNHPEIDRINRELFGGTRRTQETSARVERLTEHLEKALYEFVRAFEIDVLVPQNALSLTMNVPLGLALTRVIAETNIPTIAHHHDFHWERVRFATHAAGDYLRMAFPPVLPSIRHVVINTLAGRELAHRSGVSSVRVPNVMDYARPPGPPDEVTAQLPAELGLKDGQHLILQPTRIVPRKRIESAIELTARLGEDCVLVVSHASGDEGNHYYDYLKNYADEFQAKVIFASDRIHHTRQSGDGGESVFSLEDTYHNAQLVTYPSVIEGFGNAFLEAVYYRRPIVVHRYDVFRVDIQPKGFEVIAFDEFLGVPFVEQARAVLEDPAQYEPMLEHNYEIGRQYFSFEALQVNLEALLSRSLGL